MGNSGFISLSYVYVTFTYEARGIESLDLGLEVGESHLWVGAGNQVKTVLGQAGKVQISLF